MSDGRTMKAAKVERIANQPIRRAIPMYIGVVALCVPSFFEIVAQARWLCRVARLFLNVFMNELNQNNDAKYNR
jgi:hypothetical protein